MKVKVKFAQSYPTLCDPMDYTVHAILQARILEWVTFLFSRGSSQLRDWIQVSHIAGSLSAEKQGKPKNTGVGSLSLFQQIFPTQESNPGLLGCRQISIFLGCGIVEYKGMEFWYMLQHKWNLKYSAKWNKPDTKGQILYDFTYVRYLC